MIVVNTSKILCFLGIELCVTCLPFIGYCEPKCLLVTWLRIPHILELRYPFITKKGKDKIAKEKAKQIKREYEKEQKESVRKNKKRATILAYIKSMHLG